ncbi:hypothetical protein AVEN_163808-1 [Araneus ventricosus]|uniref:CRAL-TRIO domain-containing protein n=1 Tax=Araneus ventricosus TaxID=182803 RepID=A0A4Y2WGV0_ARAVE|nr:hypothetical protein AVEN_163808-1 [Araneus ventricosus]
MDPKEPLEHFTSPEIPWVLRDSPITFIFIFSLNQVTLHGDPKESLLSIYPPEILPEEFGGTMGNLKDIQPICMDEMKKAVPKLTESNKYFQHPYEI